ncbi:YpdA family putative bacillithiol disulfide reductase [Paenisporosarcina cavernae]|uniref:YpdA family putative bacillithiol disulfide reductase n=1 Tax=Paenisporosarcina cavernae TaxID=2320858 RepID=A0A385YRK2_9BACL|nr:YpdA family putative bacillithiol disulfide reductase [Paenisporosarcina cavernae]AYC29369.1 YpdA family putative bacillithiol disulfide reductase [Paenisporosarcina cavernae]
MKQEEIIVIGSGPCGMSAAIELQKKGFNPLIIEKGNIVQAIYNYPTHQTFFSTSEKLAIGDVPFIVEQRKPSRNQALVYYREVAKQHKLRLHRLEEVLDVTKIENEFKVMTNKSTYLTKRVVIATGYYEQPNMLGIDGEKLPHVYHYFKEGHPFFDMDVVVIGGKNSAIDAALELNKAGARVTVVYRGTEYSKSIKPWILPEFDGLVRNGEITMHFNSQVSSIKESSVIANVDGETKELKADAVFAMIGYHPDHKFLKSCGVELDDLTGRPIVKEETMETSVPNLYIAGVIAAGNNANEIFIENGRFHGHAIAADIDSKSLETNE